MPVPPLNAADLRMNGVSGVSSGAGSAFPHLQKLILHSFQVRLRTSESAALSAPPLKAGPLSSSQNSVSSGSVFSVPGILFPVSPRLCGRQNILSQRRGGAETGTRSSLILKLPELSAGDCLRQAQAARDTG